MIRIMLVDDEPLIRVAVRTLFPWEDYGFQITCEANNGETALMKLQQMRIDMIITDIKMPITDGISLIREVHSRYPSIICIVLSNYEDFNLTRNAFLAGAVDYLIKGNLKFESFLELAQRLKEHYFRDLPVESAIAPSSSESSWENQSLLLKQYLAESVSEEEYLAAFTGGKPFCMVSIRLKEPYRQERLPMVSQNEALIQQTVLKIITEISEFHSIYYPVSTLEYIALIYQEDMETFFRRKLTAFFDSLSSNIKIYLNMETVIGVSECCNDPLKARAAWLQADKCSKNIFYCEGSEVYFASDGTDGNASDMNVKTFILQNMDLLQQSARSQNGEALKKQFSQIIDLLKKAKYPPEAARQLIGNLEFLILSEISHSSRSEADFIFYHQPDQLRIMQARDISQLAQATADFLESIFSTAETAQKNKDYSPIVNSAISYLTANYIDPDTSLASTALAISANASYLSRIFFRETGIHFNAYLTNLRINCAKKLLQEKKENISNIAEKCGYSNPKYFINIFKKVAGMTPSEYQRKFPPDKTAKKP